MSNIIPKALPSQEGMGGRTVLLFLLFLLGMYLFSKMGITGLTALVVIPMVPLVLYGCYKYTMWSFWILFIVNYIIMGLGRYVNIPVQLTLIMEFIEVIVLVAILFDWKNVHGKYLNNLMGAMLGLWIFYMTLQIFNRTCDLPIHIDQWFVKFNQIALNIYLVFAITALAINKPDRISRFIRIWAVLSVAAVFWAWRQKTFGWDNAESLWLAQGGARTHIIFGAIRYFSFFSDAANFGSSIAASAAAFLVIGITSKTRFDKLFYLVTAMLCVYGLFTSGTRSSLFVFIAGVALYIVLSKSFKIAIPVAIAGALFVGMLAFTQIGQGNSMIRRMRTAFDPNDNSKGVRDVNKEALRKYMRDAPFGLGITMDPFTIPANHKYKIVSQTASDSTYVYLWEYTGIIGEVLFAVVNIVSLFGGCWIVMFRIKNRALQGIGAAFCCAFAGINVGGYVNNILLQYPNLILYYGGMAVTYLLPKIEAEYEEYEKKKIATQT